MVVGKFSYLNSSIGRKSRRVLVPRVKFLVCEELIIYVNERCLPVHKVRGTREVHGMRQNRDMAGFMTKDRHYFVFCKSSKIFTTIFKFHMFGLVKTNLCLKTCVSNDDLQRVHADIDLIENLTECFLDPALGDVRACGTFQ